MRGMTVTVERPTIGYTDGEPVTRWAAEEVDDVLVMPSASASLADALRPNGTRVVYRLAFPRPYASSLRGANVLIGGERYRIDGDPKPIRANCPTRWWMEAEAVCVDG